MVTDYSWLKTYIISIYVMNRKKPLAGEEEQLPLYRNTECVLLRVVFIYVDKTEDLIIAYLILIRNIINNHITCTDMDRCIILLHFCLLFIIAINSEF